MTSDRWIPSNYPITENIRAIYLTLEKLIQSEETQVNGIVILADYKGVSLSKASHFGPFIAKKVIGILQVWPLFVVCLFRGGFGFSQGPIYHRSHMIHKPHFSCLQSERYNSIMGRNANVLFTIHSQQVLQWFLRSLQSGQDQL